MKKSTRPVWMMPALITGSVAALGALGTLAVKSATYIMLPEKVDAAEKKNAEQDRLLDRLTVIQEQNQQLISNQMHQTAPGPDPSTQTFTEEDDQGRWTCVAGSSQECWDRKLWRVVE